MRKTRGKDHRKPNGRAAASSATSSPVSWSEEVARLMDREGMPRDKARDHVILDALKRGEGEVLAALLLEGHVPAPNIRFALALMLLDNDEAEAAVGRHRVDADALWLPHRFVLKGRPARARRPLDAERATPTKSAPVMRDLGYEAAIARLDMAVLATDAGHKGAVPAKPPARRQPPPKRKK